MALMPKRVHLVGIGGINMSGLAKLLVKSGVFVTGTDVAESELTEELKRRGISVTIGHAAEHMPEGVDLLIYSSAVPEQNPERAEARKRGIRQLTNFEFLGEWTADKKPILVCGTHGKSTTTAMLGLMLIEGGLDPTVIVGSKVPAFKDGNVYFGKSPLVVIEGDEYARHFLSFEPSAVLLNNIELDHTDVFPDLEAMVNAFRELLRRVRDNGLIVANADDPRIQTLIGEERSRLEARGIVIYTFGFGSHADQQIVDAVARSEGQVFALRDLEGLFVRYLLHLPGRMNVMNAAAAATLALRASVPSSVIASALDSFTGIWRRFEKIAERDGMTVISDYAHHPTAVAATLDAAKTFYSGRRLVLCFQPHHRNRTKHLFDAFIPSFEKADVLLLVEIYDVAGREADADQDISSRDLREAVLRFDAEHFVTRPVDYASNPQDALAALQHICKPGDVILVVGAGDIYTIAPKVLDV